MKLKVIRLGLLVFVAMTLVATPVLAYLYRAPLSINETDGNSYSMLPVVVSMNNDWLAANGFMAANALDTRVQTLGGSNKPWMIVDDKTLTASSITGNSQTNLYFVTRETPASSMDIIAGYGGYVTTADAAALELGNQFEIEIDGYFDTSTAGVYVNKSGAITIGSTGSSDIYVDMPGSGLFSSSYPSIDTFLEEAEASATDPTFTLPDGSAGDLILFVVAIDGTSTCTIPAPFTKFLDDTASSSQRVCAAYYFDTDGTGGTLQLTLSGSEPTVAHTWRISGANPAEPPEGSTTDGQSAAPNPPSETASWGAEANLWVAVTGFSRVEEPSDYPDDFTDPQFESSSDNTIASCVREYNAGATLDPTTFTISADYWVAQTIVIAPAERPIIATGISSGEQKVLVYADTTNIVIEVDDVEKDSTALSGASVTDNANDYIWLSDILPYADYITLDVGGVEVINYDPVAIISGTTLPDRTGAAQNGTFTFGANPSGVSVTLGSMTSSGQTVSTSTDTSTTDSLPVVGGTDWNEQPDVSGALLTNPFRPIVTAISDNTTLSERQVWVWLGVTFVAFITVLVGSRVRGHHLITGIAAGAAISMMVVFTIFPLLALLIAALAIIGGMVSERSPSL